MADKKTFTIDKPLLGLNGEEIKEKDEVVTLNKAIAAFLINEQRSPDPLKNYVLAQALYTGGKELDKADAQFITESLKRIGASPLLIGQFSEAFDTIK